MGEQEHEQRARPVEDPPGPADLVYQNFHFGPDGKLSRITTVNAKGTFSGDTLTGTASESVTDATGASTGLAKTAPSRAKRMQAAAP